jgi:dCTP deaminase
MTVLNDISIKKRCERVPVPMIEPYNPDQIQPASYDVRLGNTFRVFQRDARMAVDLDDPIDITKEVFVPDGSFLTLHPGEFVLGATAEKVNMPDDIVARIEGKSSIGRLGLMAHVTAGYIDPGFRGKITLEMACFHPLAIMLRPGKLIAQLSFHEMSGPAAKPYRGRYQDAEGVEASKYGQEVGPALLPDPRLRAS